MHDGHTGAAGGYNPVNINLLSLDIYFSLFCMINASKDLDQRGFSGAVFPQKCVNLTCAQLKIDII